MDKNQKIAFARSIIKLADGVLADELDRDVLISRLENGIKWLKKLDSKTSSSSPESDRLGPSKAEVDDIFQHWKIVTARPSAVLNAQRIKLVRAALKNFSAAQLKHIIVWCASDSFYSGANDRNKRYDWLENMFRSESKIEDLLERSQWGQKSTTNLDTSEGIRRHDLQIELEKQSIVALSEDRIDDYNDLQARLSELQNA